jgi:hypothetical protein
MLVSKQLFVFIGSDRTKVETGLWKLQFHYVTRFGADLVNSMECALSMPRSLTTS